MLPASVFRHALAPLRQARSYSRTLPLRATAQTAAAPPVPEAAVARHPYFVPRNTRGSLPVYTDIRNSNKYLTLIRNVEGNVDALVHDIATTLHPEGSPKLTNLKIHAVRSRHVVLSGGKWKYDVIQWLQAKGF